ncbi:MAG: hypothetical protein QF541_19750, partial [Lentisphaeria bacterium]|nr:hypothetical protein [Lentisphaeria bacterium]
MMRTHALAAISALGLCGLLVQTVVADTGGPDRANPDVWAEKSFDLAGDPVDGAFRGIILR